MFIADDPIGDYGETNLDKLREIRDNLFDKWCWDSDDQETQLKIKSINWKTQYVQVVI